MALRFLQVLVCRLFLLSMFSFARRFFSFTGPPYNFRVIFHFETWIQALGILAGHPLLSQPSSRLLPSSSLQGRSELVVRAWGGLLPRGPTLPLSDRGCLADHCDSTLHFQHGREREDQLRRFEVCVRVGAELRLCTGGTKTSSKIDLQRLDPWGLQAKKWDTVQINVENTQEEE